MPKRITPPPLVLMEEATSDGCGGSSRPEAAPSLWFDAVLAVVEPVETHFIWRPQLRDPADELVLEAAVNGQAAAIVTFSRRDFGVVPAEFGIEVLTPAEAIRRIRR
jgi:predicted nucleic acid-binding protein